MIQCATLSAPPDDSIILPNSEPSRKMKNHEAMKPVKPSMYCVTRSACSLSASGGSSAMSLVSATSRAHSGVATNRLMPRMVRTISSARPPSSPIRLNIRHHSYIYLASAGMYLRQRPWCGGVVRHGTVPRYKRLLFARRRLVPWYSIFEPPCANRLLLTCSAQRASGIRRKQDLFHSSSRRGCSMIDSTTKITSGRGSGARFEWR